MKFIVDKQELQKAMLPVTYGVSNVNNPDYKSLLMEVKGDELIIFSYDLEKGIRTTIPVEGERDGKVEADAQKLYAIIGAMDDGELTLEVDQNFLIKVTASNTDFQILGKDGHGFPNIPNIEGDFGYKLTKSKLRNIINRTVFSVSNNETNPVFTGSLFEIEGDMLKVVALDRNRIAVRCESVITDITGEPTMTKFVIPGKAENDLLRVLSDSDEEISVRMTRKHIIFTFDNIYYISRLLEGEFMNYKRLLLPENKFELTVNTKDFLESVTRAAILLESYKNNFLIVNLAEGQMNVSCTTEFGKVDDVIESTFIKGEEESLKIGFNHRILIDALRAVCEDEVKLTFNGATNPIIFSPVHDDEKSDDRFLYVVMPVQLR
ncbi:MAG: DNA polymerase III subunit beta [Ruminococcaceae bacterium]|nr:DNA polymerase III subunit beta [Oscillospiraceae bacterium]